MKLNNPKYFTSATICFVIMFFIFFGTGLENKLSSRLDNKLKYSPSESKQLVWIFFKDKVSNNYSQKEISTYLTKRSIQRRMNRIKNSEITDDLDLPVNKDYIRELKEFGLEIKQISKWFNAVSCYATKTQISMISGKSFINEIDLVSVYKNTGYHQTNDISGNGETLEQSDNNPVSTSVINYGPSLNQSNLIHVPPVHDLGYTGKNVLIASFDAGFDNLQHTCFDRMREKGLRSYDFVNGDSIVSNDTGRLGNGAHGTQTLSLICGFDPGWLISPAFDAEIILAKTENTESETPLEEDNWIAAAEWADSLGADIITSSLTYLAFNAPHPSYTWEDMDGNTARITLAAEIAVSKGIIVVSSAGNAGFNPEHNTLGAPADGKNVITVGAVTLGRQRIGFSSVGPTADGRIKPDVMALGLSTYTAFPGSGNVGYLNIGTGTSFSCPMVAGVCALMLSANPLLTPQKVKELLLNTSDKTGPPDNLTGWGIVNAYSAVLAAVKISNEIPGDFSIDQNYPNPFNPSTTISIHLKRDATLSVIIFDVLGKEKGHIVNKQFFSTGNHDLKYNPEVNGLQSGVYFYSLVANGALVDTKKFIYLK